jgi:Zn-dependent alcohol dehydrogenase
LPLSPYIIILWWFIPNTLSLQYLKGKVLVDEFITHRLPLTEINKAFDLMKAGSSIRAMIDF